MRIVNFIVAILIVSTLCSCSAPGEPASSSVPISSTTVTSSAISSEASEDVSSKPSEEKEEVLSKKDTSGKKPSSSSKPSNNTSKKPSGSTSSKKPSSSTNSKKPSSSTTIQKDYIDTSKLTYTQKDVGKVVGYSYTLGKDITVEIVDESTLADGRKCIYIVYSDGTGTSKVECQYCHKFPCPNGGGKKCTKYDIKLDGQITCQQCGRPNGDGYNGTCYGTINWNDPTKPFLNCHHYD